MRLRRSARSLHAPDRTHEVSIQIVLTVRDVAAERSRAIALEG